MTITARHYLDGRWIELEVSEGKIASTRTSEGPSTVHDDWVAPAFWDIQINGRWGHSFSSPDLTVEQVAEIVRAQAAFGTARLCPTLITAPVPHLLHGLRTIAAACERFPDVAARVIGIHLEGPFISDLEGYRGAHPVAAIRDPDWDLFQELQEAAGGRIVLITLAPERPDALEFIAKAASLGVAVAIGHTAASRESLWGAAAVGARLSTHQGNGIASMLPRHPNPIWDQLACDQLSASFIADGHHLDADTLGVLARVKGPARTILVSDASPLAGLAPGSYGDWAIEASGKIVVAGTPYLAGSNLGLDEAIWRLDCATPWDLPELLAAVTNNPARLLGRSEPRLEVGEPANLVVFEYAKGFFELKRICVDGEWFRGGKRFSINTTTRAASASPQPGSRS
jgi:N-acetylglucosamine-6-phosphate deacetylase